MASQSQYPATETEDEEAEESSCPTEIGWTDDPSGLDTREEQRG